MKVFLSWSGKRAEAAAQIFKELVEDVLQKVTPWMSTTDIELGAVGFDEIRKSLDASNYGIVFVTIENLAKPWLMFELGALAKQVDSSRVIPLLVDKKLTPAMLLGPMGQFQATLEVERTSIHRLLKQLNKDSGAPIDNTTLDRCFSYRWPAFWSAWEGMEDSKEEPPVIDSMEMNSRIYSMLVSLQRDVASLKRNAPSRMERYMKDHSGRVYPIKSKVFEAGLRTNETLEEKMLHLGLEPASKDAIRVRFTELLLEGTIEPARFRVENFNLLIHPSGNIQIESDSPG